MRESRECDRERNCTGNETDENGTGCVRWRVMEETSKKLEKNIAAMAHYVIRRLYYVLTDSRPDGKA